jgi:putative PIG3 family NAD(P)H quinone oxidoreductase
MKAVLIKDDESNSLYIGEVATPRPGPHEVLVKVHATAVNRADLLQRRGLYPPPPGAPDILGLEAAGEIAEKGAAVSHWSVGERVCALLSGGGYAEYVAVNEGVLLPIPNHLTYEEAAAIPEVFYTAFVNLFLEADLKAGERVLIHAGASGVGTAGIQLARQRGATVYITASSERKITRCLELGAHFGINYTTEDFEQRVKELTKTKGVDVILDCVGGSYLNKNIALLSLKGRLVLIGLMGGADAEINLRPLLTKRIRLIGSVLRSRSLEEKIEITQKFKEQVLPWFVEKKIHPVVDSVYPIEELESAHLHVAENKNIGKVVLRMKRGT